jgi:16S rRNA processing protein RimM
VDYLIETGGNDVLVVKPSDDSIDDRERLIPYLPDDVVTRVDLEQGVIEVDWFLDE